MDPLTLSLGVLGAAVVAGLAVHGAWQARRAGPKRAVPVEPHAEPREPVLDAASLDGLQADAPDDDAPVLLPHGGPERRRGVHGPVRLDALIDAIATLTVEAPLAGEQVTPHLPGTRRAGSKPFLIEALPVEGGEWEMPSNGERYREFQVGVQLANRTGALNEIEYSEFVQKAQAFADAIGALPDFPDMLDVVARARELDQFAGAHDAQLALRLRARGAAWSVAYIQQHALRHGFLPGVVPGRLVMPAGEEGSPPLLTLTFDSQAALADDPNLAAVRELTLNFDVPQTAPAANPFAAWQASAEALAADMEAAIVDDRGQALSAAGFEAIGTELQQLYAALAERDLPAGSAAARRLFS